jgi:hypothetical protein
MASRRRSDALGMTEGAQPQSAHLRGSEWRRDAIPSALKQRDCSKTSADGCGS